MKQNNGIRNQRHLEMRSTGRRLGSICQHLSITFLNNGGQFDGISGVNPVSL
jgi:hypothetical protein